MKYGVKNCNDGLIGEDTKTDDVEKALSHARSLANWNIECEVVDLESGEPLKHCDPYNQAFANSKENLLRQFGARSGVPFSPEH
jgi:hypothetical protein